MKYWLLAFLKQELKYKAKTKKEFYKITSRIDAVGDRVDSQNGHQEFVILSIFLLEFRLVGWNRNPSRN